MVLYYYNNLREEENEKKEDYMVLIERDVNKIKGRFTKEIQPKVNRFNMRYLKPALDRDPSGQTELVKVACDDWRKAEGKTFHLVHCLEPLKYLPKFNITSTSFQLKRKKWLEEDTGNDESGIIDISSGTGNVPRPIGQKAAKLESKLQQAHRHAIAAGDGSIDRLGSLMGKLDQSITVRNLVEQTKLTLQHRESAERNHKDKIAELRASVSMYKDLPGYDHKIPALVQQIEEMMERGPDYEGELANMKPAAISFSTVASGVTEAVVDETSPGVNTKAVVDETSPGVLQGTNEEPALELADDDDMEEKGDEELNNEKADPYNSINVEESDDDDGSKVGV